MANIGSTLKCWPWPKAVQGNECKLRSGITSGKTAIQNYKDEDTLSTPKVIQQNLKNQQNLLNSKLKQIQDQIDRSSKYAGFKGELFY